MIFVKKKKRIFTFYQPVKTTDEVRYRAYRDLYGEPELTNFGEHVWRQMPEKFICDAKTGNILIRTREIRYLGRSENGYHYYLGPKSKLGAEQPKPSFH
jgi:hypothetical protein